MFTTEHDISEDRFAFGKNWRNFSKGLDEEQIVAARVGIERLLAVDDLTGRTFLDVGSGSGLMSLAAHQMGARVTAFDYDGDSVATTVAIRDAAVGADAYPVLQGSALDPAFVTGLGQFDIVYSWGVLHHTGDLWQACEVVIGAVAPGGLLAVALYNDQGMSSQVWKRIKRAYVQGSPLHKRALLIAGGTYFGALSLAVYATKLRKGWKGLVAERRERAGRRSRGMDRRHDLVDWVGGYPFEVSKPDEVFDFFHDRGFTLERLTTVGGDLACNEFVFRKPS